MEEKNSKNIKKEITQWVFAIVIIAAVAFVLRAFVFTTVIVKGPSMEPTYVHGNVVLTEKISYLFGKPQRNDIVVCEYQTDDELIIKRVIGVPGDEIDIFSDRDKYRVAVNGYILDETYIKEDMQQPGDMEYPYVVPEGCYFVMGDNRNVSSDSRFMSIGAIPKENIEGKVVFKLFGK